MNYNPVKLKLMWVEIPENFGLSKWKTWSCEKTCATPQARALITWCGC